MVERSLIVRYVLADASFDWNFLNARWPCGEQKVTVSMRTKGESRLWWQGVDWPARASLSDYAAVIAIKSNGWLPRNRQLSQFNSNFSASKFDLIQTTVTATSTRKPQNTDLPQSPPNLYRRQTAAKIKLAFAAYRKAKSTCRMNSLQKSNRLN